MCYITYCQINHAYIIRVIILAIAKNYNIYSYRQNALALTFDRSDSTFSGKKHRIRNVFFEKQRVFIQKMTIYNYFAP